MASSPQQHYHEGPEKCIVYWDYENIPLPNGAQLRTVMSVLKKEIWNKIGPKEIPIEFKLYIRASKLDPYLQDAMDVNGVEHINISSPKPEAVDKRILIDMALRLYELEKHKKSNVIALISGDRDFGHLLSRIHKQPPISHSFLILLNQKQRVNPNLSNHVDFVLNDFNDHSFKLCPNKECKQKPIHCPYHHPANNYYDFSSIKYNQYPFNKDNKYKKRKKNKKKRHRYNENHNDCNSNQNHSHYKRPKKRQRTDPQNINNKNNKNNKNNNNYNFESDSSIEIIENIKKIKAKNDNNTNNDNNNSDKITITICEIGGDREEMMIDVNINHLVNTIKNKMRDKSNNDDIIYRFGDTVLLENRRIREYNISDGDTITWYIRKTKIIPPKIMKVYTLSSAQNNGAIINNENVNNHNDRNENKEEINNNNNNKDEEEDDEVTNNDDTESEKEENKETGPPELQRVIQQTVNRQPLVNVAVIDLTD